MITLARPSLTTKQLGKDMSHNVGGATGTGSGYIPLYRDSQVMDVYQTMYEGRGKEIVRFPTGRTPRPIRGGIELGAE